MIYTRLLLLVLAVSGLLGCGKASHQASSVLDSLDSSSDLGDSPPVTLTAAAFQDTVHKVVQTSGCVQCHGAGPAPTTAWFASSNLDTAFRAGRVYVTPSAPESSLLARRMTDGHCGLANVCQVDNSPLIAAIKQWIQISTEQAGACAFNGTTILNGASGVGYSTDVVPYGGNCNSVKVPVQCNNGVITPSNAFGSCSVAAGAACSFNGQMIPSGGTVRAYLAANSPPGGACASEIRTCTNGNLSGSYTFASCALTPALSCTFNNMSVPSGSTVQGYPAATVPFGQTCQPRTITCTNGVLNPANHVASCSVLPGASCTFNGQTIASGGSVTAYQAASVPNGQTCAMQTRVCTNGSLSGTYAFASCAVAAPATCTFNNMTIPSGGTVQGYPSSTVPYGQTCQARTITCDQGVLNPPNHVAACTVSPPASCTFNGQTVASGSSVDAFQASTVPFGSTCMKQTRTCTNGSLSGTYTFGSCTVSPPLSCMFNGMPVASGATVQGYPSASVPYGGTCTPQTITCTNGVLNPANYFASCSVAAGASCSYNGQTYASGTSFQGYTSATVPAGQTCQPISIQCQNGQLSPATFSPTCSVLVDTTSCVNSATPRRVWMLSRSEVDATLSSVLAANNGRGSSVLPPEARANGYSSNVSNYTIDATMMSSLLQFAEAVAADQAQAELNKVNALVACTLSAAPSATTQDPCAVKYINARGKSLFRRPLTTGEVNALYTAYVTGFQSPDSGMTGQLAGMQTLLTSFMLSPGFLYRTELGSASDTASAMVNMTPHEVAASLSYILTGSSPDATLMTAADNQQLSTPDQIAAQAQRLITSTAGHAQVEKFVLEWMKGDEVTKAVGANGSPVTAALAQAMLTETRKTVEHAVFTGSGTFAELLNANYTFANRDLANYYGLTPGSATDTVTHFKISSGPRRGLLSHGTFLAPPHKGVPMFHRGIFVRGQILCENLPTLASLGLDGFVPPALPAPQPGVSARMQITQAIPKGTACYSCHQYFHPIGFGLENFDKWGRYRTVDNGANIDPSGEIVKSAQVDPVTGSILAPNDTTSQPFADSVDLAVKLSSSAQAQQCFAKHITTFSSGRPDLANNNCAVRTLQSQFAATNGNVVSGFMNYLKSTFFIQRQR